MISCGASWPKLVRGASLLGASLLGAASLGAASLGAALPKLESGASSLQLRAAFGGSAQDEYGASSSAKVPSSSRRLLQT